MRARHHPLLMILAVVATAPTFGAGPTASCQSLAETLCDERHVTDTVVSGQSESSAETRLHVVTEGETLQSIAARHDTTPEAIREYNRLPEGYQVVPGDSIRIPALNDDTPHVISRQQREEDSSSTSTSSHSTGPAVDSRQLDKDDGPRFGTAPDVPSNGAPTVPMTAAGVPSEPTRDSGQQANMEQPPQNGGGGIDGATFIIVVAILGAWSVSALIVMARRSPAAAPAFPPLPIEPVTGVQPRAPHADAAAGNTATSRPVFKVEPIAANNAESDPVSTAAHWTGDVVGRRPLRSPTTAVPIRGLGWVPAVVSDFGDSETVVYRGASMRGDYARHTGKPRQDSFGIAMADDGDLVIAVADGVASAARSELGSQTAVLVATHTLLGRARPTGDGDMRAAFDRAAAAIRATSERNPSIANESDLATTLVVAVVMGHEYVVARVGDSTAWALAAGSWLDLFEAPATPVKDSRTTALPFQAQCEITRGVIEPGSALVLATDGVGDPIGSGRTPVARYLGKAWASPPDPLQFVHSLGFRSRSFDDDRTAVALWRRHS